MPHPSPLRAGWCPSGSGGGVISPAVGGRMGAPSVGEEDPEPPPGTRRARRNVEVWQPSGGGPSLARHGGQHDDVRHVCSRLGGWPRGHLLPSATLRLPTRTAHDEGKKEEEKK